MKLVWFDKGHAWTLNDVLHMKETKQ